MANIKFLKSPPNPLKKNNNFMHERFSLVFVQKYNAVV